MEPNVKFKPRNTLMNDWIAGQLSERIMVV